MRFRTTMPRSLSASATQPEDTHDDQYRDELQPDTPPHQRLRQVRTAAAHHVDKAEKQNNHHGADGDADDDIRQTVRHRPNPVLAEGSIAPHETLEVIELFLGPRRVAEALAQFLEH